MVKLVGVRYCHVIFDDGIRTKVRIDTLKHLPSDYSGDALPPKVQKPKDTFVIDPNGNHNKYICEKCSKGFRKESLLLSHIKHYHNQDNDGASTSDNTTSTVGSNVAGSSGYETRIRERRHREIYKEDTGGVSALTSAPISGTSTPEPITLKSETTKIEDMKVDEPLPEEPNNLKLRLNLASLMEAGGSSSEDTVINENYVERDVETPTSVVSVATATTSATTATITSKKKRGGDRRSHAAGKNFAHHHSCSNNFSSNNSKRAKLEDGGYPYYYNCSPQLWKKPKGNNVVSYFDARQTRDEHENDNIEEVVKCICSYMEENGLMVQCELCLTWQHALCMGYKHESDVPSDGYVSSLLWSIEIFNFSF